MRSNTNGDISNVHPQWVATGRVLPTKRLKDSRHGNVFVLYDLSHGTRCIPLMRMQVGNTCAGHLRAWPLFIGAQAACQAAVRATSAPANTLVSMIIVHQKSP